MSIWNLPQNKVCDVYRYRCELLELNKIFQFSCNKKIFIKTIWLWWPWSPELLTGYRLSELCRMMNRLAFHCTQFPIMIVALKFNFYFCCTITVWEKCSRVSESSKNAVQKIGSTIAQSMFNWNRSIFIPVSYRTNLSFVSYVNNQHTPCIHFSYLIESDVCYLVMCDKMYSKRLAFNYLEDIAQEFHKNYGRKVNSVTRPYAFIEFDVYIQKAKKQLTDRRRNINAINNQLQDVQRIMVSLNLIWIFYFCVSTSTRTDTVQI